MLYILQCIRNVVFSNGSKGNTSNLMIRVINISVNETLKTEWETTHGVMVVRSS